LAIQREKETLEKGEKYHFPQKRIRSAYLAITIGILHGHLKQKGIEKKKVKRPMNRLTEKRSC